MEVEVVNTVINWQTAFNITFGVLLGLLGAILLQLWISIKETRRDNDQRLAEMRQEHHAELSKVWQEHHNLALLVRDEYVSKPDHRISMDVVTKANTQALERVYKELEKLSGQLEKLTERVHDK